MQKAKNLHSVTQTLNKSVSKLLDSFSANTQWTDINNWLQSLEAVLKDNPSPYITDKILLSKRLNQCINPILPHKIHEQVLRIHEILFFNMRSSVDNDINEYIKLFADDLGLYSVSILPYFAHSTVNQHRLLILQMLNNYFLDLGYELIPMHTGIMKALLPVYDEVNDENLLGKIEQFVDKLIQKSGRHYVISALWTSILKFQDCRCAGIKFMSRIIPKMEYRKDQQEFESEHGFSQQQQQLRKEQQLEQLLLASNHPQTTQQIKRPHSVKSTQQKIPIEKLPAHQVFSSSSFSKMDLPEYDNQPFDSANSPTRLRLQKRNTFDPLTNINLSAVDEIKIESVPEIQKAKKDGTPKLQNSQFGFDKYDNEVKTGHKIKLDKVPLMMKPGFDSIKYMAQANNNSNNYPNHSTLVINAIIVCLEDSSQFIKRAALDFIFSHLRLKSNVLNDNDRRILVEAVIRLFRKMEMSIIKRVNRWLLGKEDENGRHQINDKNSFVIPLISHAFTSILSRQPKNQQTCIAPIKIAQNFYMQHENLVEMTIGHISIQLLRYIFNYSSGFQFSPQALKAGNRFFSNIPSHYPLLLTSLGKKLLEGVQTKNDHLAFESVRYFDYCYIKLMSHEHGIQQLEYITITLQMLTQGCRIIGTLQKEGSNFYKIYLKDLVLLIYNLISRRESVQKFMEKQKNQADAKYLSETGQSQLPIERVQYQKQIAGLEEKQKQRYFSILENMEVFFIQLGFIIKTSVNTQMFEEIYKLSSMSLVKLLGSLPVQTKINQLPKWFESIQHGIRVSSPSISLSAIDSLIKCLLQQEKHPIYAQFKTLILGGKNKNSGDDYQSLALQKLWALLDYPHMHSRIIDLIVAFSKFFPYDFTETVKKSFDNHSDHEKQASIQRFSHFWRLTGFKYKDLLLSNREFAELNKVGLFKMLDFLDDPNPLVRYAAKNWMIESLPLFHRVIEPLFFQLMRAGGDWYSTPKGLLLIKEVYDTKNIFNTFRRIRSLLSNGTYSFLRYVYEQQISESLEELRQRVTPISESILTDTDTKQQIVVVNKQQKEPVLPQALVKKDTIIAKKKLTYIDILIILSVKFIQGHALESMGLDFYRGNEGVNTSAIQLLESLLNYIDNPTVCYKLIQFIVDPLCKVLSQAVANEQYISQIQLLNLFKTIFFSSSFRKKGTIEQVRGFFNKFFSQSPFLDSMLNGLRTQFAYVRSQFINFITSCIQLIADFLQPEQCTQCIKKILLSYYRIIKDIKVSLIQQVIKGQDIKAQRINQIESSKDLKQSNMKVSRIAEMEINSKQQQKFTKISNNMQQVANTNQILSILHGLSAILNYFYDLDKMTINQMKFQFDNSYTFFDSFKSIITLGLASSTKSGRLIEKNQFYHNLQTCQSILKDLQPVYETILRSWPLSEQFVRIATEEFSSIGSRTFNFEKFSKYNNVLKNLIDFVSKQKESIWGKIFSILQPMFYRFPRQIMEIYLSLWVRQCTNAGQSKSQMDMNEPLEIQLNIASTQFLMKNIETIVVSNFPINIIVHAFLQSKLIQQITSHHTNSKNKNSLALNPRISQIQAKLLFFLYIYFSYNYIDHKNLSKEVLLDIWSNILKAIRPFTVSKAPTTAMWIIDLINMCSIKFSPKQILDNEKFKSDLHSVVNTQLIYIASIASKKQTVFYDDPTVQTINNSQTDKFRIVLPIPPTLFQIYKSPKTTNQIDNQLFKPTKLGDYVQIERINRLWCFKLLRQRGFEILQNTYLADKIHFAIIRACQWVEIILPTIENKSIDFMVYAESASEVLYKLLEQARLLFIKPLRASIFRIFDKDDFFICNKNTLIYWAQIIDWVVSSDKNNQTFALYLSKVSLANSYFTSQSVQNKNRIKSFERICFILFSGNQDKYAFKIKGLLEKIADVIKKAEASHPALLILVLFSIRILILRLSEISLNQLFIDIWPMILAFLMQIFSKNLVKVEIANEISKNPNLILAALKLIEMISINNLTEFAHHQWIFIYDYFGINISLTQSTPELSQILCQQPQLSSLASFSRSQISSPFNYKPYMNNYISHHSVDYLPQPVNLHTGYESIPRMIIVKKTFVTNEDELKAYAYFLGQYLVKVNEYRMEMNKKEVEEIIINDFIKLDSFIHQI